MTNSNKEKDERSKADNTPAPEIPIPSTTPYVVPSIPGIDRTENRPERDTRSFPEEFPQPRETHEIGPSSIPNIDENRPH